MPPLSIVTCAKVLVFKRVAEGADATILSGTLQVKHSSHNITLQTVISLQFSTPGDDADSNERFWLVYDPAQLYSGSIEANATTPISIQQQNEIALHKSSTPRVRTLCLKPKQACRVLHCNVSQPTAPHRRPILDIATAPEVHVLFDANWFNAVNWETFQFIITQPHRLTQLPLEFGNRVKWTDLHFVDEDAAEAPPPYHASKRVRSESPSSPSPVKRVCLTPTPESQIATQPNTQIQTQQNAQIPTQEKAPTPTQPNTQEPTREPMSHKVKLDMQNLMVKILQDALRGICSCSPPPSISSSRSPSSTPPPFVLDSQAKLELRRLLPKAYDAKVDRMLTGLFDKLSDSVWDLIRHARRDLDDCISDERSGLGGEFEQQELTILNLFNEKSSEFKGFVESTVENMRQEAELIAQESEEKVNLKKVAVVQDPPDRSNRYGSALQSAAFGGHRKVVKLLIDEGADIDAPGGRYGSALQSAAFGGHTKIVKLLIEQGADIDAPGGRYGSALQSAAFGGHRKIVKLLIEQGADIDAPVGH